MYLGTYALASLDAFSFRFIGFGLSPPSWPLTPPSKVVPRLIVVLGPNFRVSSSCVAAALRDCIGLQDIVFGGFHLNLIDVPSADAQFFLHLMGPQDPPPDFLPTHLVLWVPPRLFSLAHVGFIYNNGTNFMSQYLTPLASSLPGTAPGPLVHLGGCHMDSSLFHQQGVLCTPLPFTVWGVPHVSLWGVPCAPLSLKTLLPWSLLARIQKRIFLGQTYAMGFDV